MRTTLNLDDELIRRAREVAARTGSTLTRLIEDALRQSLERRDRSPVEPLDLPTVGGRGLQPGVDLDDSASLLELMERDDAAR
ncbi:MAG: type II toxin-antitoxin system VapB family antitoxin [Actinomycetota bacterium]|nr:type II toxin-antitoxin system VapB family antitoxin [Actinomycetota bacterium]